MYVQKSRDEYGNGFAVVEKWFRRSNIISIYKAVDHQRKQKILVEIKEGELLFDKVIWS